MDDAATATAVELTAALARRELSAVEALEATLARADALTPALNPFAVRLDDRALAAARRADAARSAGTGGPLCGLPITIKDSHYLAGYTASVGSLALRDFVPTGTCAAVERLERAGAVIFAKTATPEFCLSGVTDSPLNGATHNPWNRDRVTGGSSGGAGACVAAGIGSISLGGDGGGSIRIPSAFCGVVGLKPTHGLVPREPCGTGWKTIAVYGPMARSVADVRLAMSVVAGFDGRDRYSLGSDAGMFSSQALRPEGVRIAFSYDLGHATLDDDVRSAFTDLLGRLEHAGCELVEDDPGLGSSVDVWCTVAYSDSAVAERQHLLEHGDDLGEHTVELLYYGHTFSPMDIWSAAHQRERIHAAYVDLFDRTGAVAFLTPTMGGEAFEQGRRWPPAIGDRVMELPDVDWAPFMPDANLTGLPAAAVPIGLGDEGLPVSVQVLGRRLGDGDVLAVAELIEHLSPVIGQPKDIDT